MRLGAILLNLLLCILDTGEGSVGNHGQEGHNPLWTATPSREQVRRECHDSEYRPYNKDYCCNRCNPGYYKKEDCTGPGTRTLCRPCQAGSFTAIPNFVPKCKSCLSCSKVYGQIEIEPCRKDKNRVCGCEPQKYQKRVVDIAFQCLNCTSCKFVMQKCGGYNDTICHCEPGQYYDLVSKKCQSCERCRLGSDCAAFCSTSAVNITLLSLAILPSVGLLLIALGALMYCLHRRYTMQRWNHSQSETGFTSSSELVTPCSETLLPVQEFTQTKSLTLSKALVELPDCVLVAGQRQLPNNSQVNYVIADLVPASRWKEFVRRLGMTDSDIERTEMDNRHSFREAQYEMVRVWRQKRGAGGATTEVICKVLNDMELNGCAEKFQEALQ